MGDRSYSLWCCPHGLQCRFSRQSQPCLYDGCMQPSGSRQGPQHPCFVSRYGFLMLPGWHESKKPCCEKDKCKLLVVFCISISWIPVEKARINFERKRLFGFWQKSNKTVLYCVLRFLVSFITLQKWPLRQEVQLITSVGNGVIFGCCIGEQSVCSMHSALLLL